MCANVNFVFLTVIKTVTAPHITFSSTGYKLVFVAI